MGKKISPKRILMYTLAIRLGGLLLPAIYQIFGSALIGKNTALPNPPTINASQINYAGLAQEVLPSQGYVFPIKWSNIPDELVASGALNVSHLSVILNQSGEPLTVGEKRILNGTSDANITLNQSDALFVLDVLWEEGSYFRGFMQVNNLEGCGG